MFNSPECSDRQKRFYQAFNNLFMMLIISKRSVAVKELELSTKRALYGLLSWSLLSHDSQQLQIDQLPHNVVSRPKYHQFCA